MWISWPFLFLLIESWSWRQRHGLLCVKPWHARRFQWGCLVTVGLLYSSEKCSECVFQELALAAVFHRYQVVVSDNCFMKLSFVCELMQLLLHIYILILDPTSILLLNTKT